MKFKSFFNENINENIKNVSKKELITEDDDIQKIRKAKIKIKTVIPTRFGTEVEFFNAGDAEKANDLIIGSQLDKKSIFIRL